MAKYTIELGTLVKQGYNIFDESWDTFIPEHKEELCDKIIRHYWFNEIGAETPDRFKHYLNEQLALMMPTYNRLYESELWELLPLYNHIMEIEGEETDKTYSSGLSSSRSDKGFIKSFGQSIHRDSKQDDWQKFDGKTTETYHETGNLTGNHNEDETINTTADRVIDKHLDQTDNRTINEVTKQTEVVDTDTTTKTTGNESIIKNTSEYSSDTPQGRIVNNELSIDAQYLTNYQHGTETTNRNYTENVTGTVDTTTELYRTTDTKDDLTRQIDEHNTDNYKENVTRNKVNKDIEDTTKDSNKLTVVDNVQHDTSDLLAHEFNQGSENSGENITNAGTSEESHEGTKTNKRIIKGNIGQSKTDLLMKYRQSLINIDAQIIKDIAVNFMGVF